MAFRSIPQLAELADFALMLFKIVVNQAGCERVFSDLKIKQTHHRVRLGLPKLAKMTKIGTDIKAEHRANGLVKERGKRGVHKSVETLLAVPRYSDLLADQDNEDEDEHGQMLVSNRAGWRTEMAKWIGDARNAEAEEVSQVIEDADDSELARAAETTSSALEWKPMTLEVLFGGLENRFSGLGAEEINAEGELMEALANLAEEQRLDDGAVEIDSDDEYIG